MLTVSKGLPKELYQKIWEDKQSSTISLIYDTFIQDNRMKNILKSLKEMNFIIAVASNSIRETVKAMLLKLDLMRYVDFFVSNQDVKNPKPNVEMYLRCMIKAGVSPKETVIIEDSHIGRKAALDSGAYLCAVKNPEDVTLEKIMKVIDMNDKTNKPKWIDKSLNVLIPMAGAGSRFEKAGYTFPKTSYRS